MFSMRKQILLLFPVIIIKFSFVAAQTARGFDSLKTNAKATPPAEMRYNIGNGKTLVYTKPRNFGFVLNLPKDAATLVSTTGKKESVKPLLLIAATTGLLIWADQPVVDGVRQFSDNIHLYPDEKNV